ncbi:response regulator [Arvimicrobium flavum]|uniref:response regulator n=1 Tax=Arvimicrobium flavum TaxID=3393320 RepID=UPI00237B904F|nr:response regulator [Mesorhizobium shangrilense]
MKRCLFVDDSNVIRKVAKRILTGPDVLVLEAGTGFEAIDMCAEYMPDYILVDAVLPDLPVEDFIRNVRSIQGSTPPRIAICLTEMDVPAIMRAKRAGAQGYLLKPFDRAQLLDNFRVLQAAA